MPIFMKIMDRNGRKLIKGESTHKLHTHWIDLSHFSLEQSRNTGTGSTTASRRSGSEAGGGHASAISSEATSASLLAGFSSSGRQFDMQVEFVKDESSIAYLICKFRDCIVSSVRPSPLGDGDGDAYAFEFGVSYGSTSAKYTGPETAK